MKIKKSMLTLALALAVMCGITIGASASSTLQEIKAYLNTGITIKYKGETQNLTDAAGNRVYPISYNGTTYLPVRGIGNMLGLGVDWDQATQTVLLSNSSSSTANGDDLLELFEPYSFTKDGTTWTDDERYYQQVQKSEGKTEKIGGVETDHWAVLHTGKKSKPRTASGYYNIGGKYSTLTFKAYSDRDVTISVYGDNESLLGEYTVKASQVPQTYTVKVQSHTQLRFQMSPNSEEEITATTYIFDVYLQ